MMVLAASVSCVSVWTREYTSIIHFAGKRMKAFVFVLMVALAMAVTLETSEPAREKRTVKEEAEAEAVAENIEREEITEKTAPQIYSYRPPTLSGGTVYPSNLYPNNVYPNTIIPSSIPGVGTNGVYPFIPTVGDGTTEAFSARRASPFSIAGARVVLTEQLTQVGTGWNSGRSEYVAPNTGVYFFTFSAVSDRYTHFRVSLRHNGQDVVTAFGDASGYQMGSQSAVLRLNSGDRVVLQLQEGRLYDVTSSRAYTTFSGFKIA